MIEYILQNFNWPTFLIALGFFVLVSNIFSLIMAVIQKKRAERAVQKTEEQYNELRAKLIGKQKELNTILGTKEQK
jgi:hypothetical protein